MRRSIIGTLPRLIRLALLATAMVDFALQAPQALAQPSAATQSTEERFQDLFVTAGYTTAFGAALGTACLALVPGNPSDHLQFVAVGASLGFIGGSIMGSYLIFSPLMAAHKDGEAAAGGNLAVDAPLPDHGLVLRPTFSADHHNLTSLEGGLTLARF